jgi:hypothetical protein
MTKTSAIGATLVAAAVLCAAPISLHQSQDGLSLSVDKARAVIGRPLTPGSIAGVHRRYERRAYRGGYYGAGYGYYGYRHHPYAAAGTAPGQLTCKEAAKLQFPNERHMRKAFKKECKQAYKASRTTSS